MREFFRSFSERWRVEGKDNPIGRLPRDLSMRVIYGNEEEYREAYKELHEWSVSTNIEILDAELEYLADARDQVGFNFQQRKS